jgi:hypothetical protein
VDIFRSSDAALAFARGDPTAQRWCGCSSASARYRRRGWPGPGPEGNESRPQDRIWRLSGELGWAGVNSRRLSSKRPSSGQGRAAPGAQGRERLMRSLLALRLWDFFSWLRRLPRTSARRGRALEVANRHHQQQRVGAIGNERRAGTRASTRLPFMPARG